MFVMTPAAGGYLSTVLERAKAPEETAIRLALDGDTLTSKLDVERPGDATFDHDGKKVLVMDDRVSALLSDSKLDVQPSSEGERLVLVA